jgi:hypothetical protein
MVSTLQRIVKVFGNIEERLGTIEDTPVSGDSNAA